ncbi:substrate-binding periplasmic protein [Piscinibacter sakaiensis]|uniref:Putative periplasmic binding protein n=1 Tax=Piscinibacter sakaiensis TaxID=1547922 RepID=A0A0K8NWZ3_PISS1|nr:transporter substrate-binding domain-containing protein [Piscinibacter sakaiensis]GAP34455.1 putative periplasmic binding protein [Piscinibacter sakaiensis]
MTASTNRAPRRPGRRALLRGAGAALLGAAGLGAAPAARAITLDKVRERGALVVGVYQDMPPFHVDGQGIDVELARALAQALGLKLTLLPFHADENMDDDLRNMVWRGHYLGFGPADVLLHVPVDKPLMDATPQALIFGPYFRERVAIARDLSRLPKLEALSDLGQAPVAVPGQSLAGWLLIGSDGGAYREQLRTKLKDGVEAAQMLRRGEVAAAGGLLSELQSVLRDDPRYAIEPLPSPRAPRNGWVVGMAVKKDGEDLARELQRAVNALAQAGTLERLFAAGGVRWRPV